MGGGKWTLKNGGNYKWEQYGKVRQYVPYAICEKLLPPPSNHIIIKART